MYAGLRLTNAGRPKKTGQTWGIADFDLVADGGQVVGHIDAATAELIHLLENGSRCELYRTADDVLRLIVVDGVVAWAGSKPKCNIEECVHQAQTYKLGAVCEECAHKLEELSQLWGPLLDASISPYPMRATEAAAEQLRPLMGLTDWGPREHGGHFYLFFRSDSQGDRVAVRYENETVGYIVRNMAGRLEVRIADEPTAASERVRYNLRLWQQSCAALR